MADTKKKITLGSGKLYVTEFKGKTLPEKETLEVEDNLLGHILGGATLEYTPTFYEVKDDLGLVSKTVITEEEAKLTTGVLTFNGNTLAKLCATARVTEDSKTRTVLFGGISNQDGKSYVIHFVHTDKVEGDIRVTIVGRNEKGFTLAFAKDKETVIDAEFKAQPQDNEGTLIKFVEDIKPAVVSLTQEKTK